MSKSVTILNKEIADSLRFHSLTKPPEIVELTKLSEDIDKILNKPPNFLQSGPMLDNYYGKLIKFMTLLKNANYGSYPQRKTSQPELSPEPDSSENIQQQEQEPLIDLTFPDPTSIQQPPPHTPPHTPPQNFQTVSPISPHAQALSNIQTELKKNLLLKIADKDKHFVYDHDGEKLVIRGKPYSMVEFDNLYSRLRSPKKMNIKKLNDVEKELINVVTETLENIPAGQSIIKKLPGLAAVIVGEAEREATKKRSARNPQKPRISSKSPVSSRSNTSARKNRSSIKQIGKGHSKIEPLLTGKIHFKRWNKFIKLVHNQHSEHRGKLKIQKPKKGFICL
jgi:hypothetical protein